MAASLAAAAVLGGSLSGCVSTQHKNARAKLVADRTLEGRRPLRLAERSRAVRVLSVAVVRGRRDGAIVVELRNRDARTLTDVPIAVGVRAGNGRRVQLNGGHGLGWFRTHVPAIGAGARATWVFVARRALPGGRPWAAVGAVGAAQVREADAPPRIDARVLPARAAGRGRNATRPGAVRVALVNRSDVPQYGLQVYAVVRAHGRVVAAGAATVRHLGSRASGSARVALAGAAGHHRARVDALATIFD